jgi:L-2-hydroxycarboxylate dehydrogenase (NAD+)
VNKLPDASTSVPWQAMQSFVAQVGRAAGLPPRRAELLARLLTENDLRGIWSHGTRQIATYARLMRDGALNANPEPEVISESRVSLSLDGDGGLGYFPAYEGTLRVVEKARKSGVAILQTRNHGHFGAAGIYARLTLGHDLLTFVTSGHQLSLSPGDPVHAAAGGSPFAWSAQTGEEDPLVLDFGTMHDLYLGESHRDDLAAMVPGIVLRHIGMGMVCQAWGGLLAGVPVDPARASRRFAGANQGCLLITFRIDLFVPPAQFKAEMDEYARKVRSLTPIAGLDRSSFPGAVEDVLERELRERGIPLGDEHRRVLVEIGKEMGVAVPW